MKYCPNCGAETENSNRCENCGFVSEFASYFVEEKPSMLEAYVSMWKNYAKFSGRSRRSEYWLAALVNMLINIALILFANFINTQFFMIISGLYSIAAFIPGLALCVRRLHDSGKSGHILWSLFALIIPFANFAVIVMLLVFLCMDSTKGSNKYGEGNKYYIS